MKISKQKILFLILVFANISNKSFGMQRSDIVSSCRNLDTSLKDLKSKLTLLKSGLNKLETNINDKGAEPKVGKLVPQSVVKDYAQKLMRLVALGFMTLATAAAVLEYWFPGSSEYLGNFFDPK